MTTKNLRLGKNGIVQGVANGEEITIRGSKITDLETIQVATHGNRNLVTIYVYPSGNIYVTAHSVKNVTIFGEGTQEYTVERKIDICPEVDPNNWYDVIEVEQNRKVD